MRRMMILATTIALTIAVSACGSSSKTGTAGNKNTQISLTEAGCDPATLELPPGPTTFEITNDGADAVSEFEILDGTRVLGERENLTPGLSGTFTITLKPGTYTTYCPGGKSVAKGKLIVTAASTGTTTT